MVENMSRIQNIEYLKTSKLKIEVLDKKEEFKINLDGEYGGDTPVELEVFHNHLEFLPTSMKLMTMPWSIRNIN